MLGLQGSQSSQLVLHKALAATVEILEKGLYKMMDIAKKIQSTYNILLMYISNNKYRLAQLKEDNLYEAAKLLADQFFLENKVWRAAQLTIQEIKQFMVDKIKQKIAWQNELRQSEIISGDTYLSFVYLDQNDKIIGVWTSIELMQYLTKKSKVKLPKLQVVQQQGLELQKTIQPSDKIPGYGVYADYGAIEPKQVGAGTIMLLWLDGCHYLHSKGFRVLYGRASNVKTFSLMSKYGGFKTAIKKAKLNQKQVTLSFLKWNLDPIDYVNHIVQQHIQKGNQKAKL